MNMNSLHPSVVGTRTDKRRMHLTLANAPSYQHGQPANVGIMLHGPLRDGIPSPITSLFLLLHTLLEVLDVVGETGDGALEGL